MSELTVAQVASESDRVVFSMAGISAEILFPWFIDPRLLTKWWAEQATVEPKLGGLYEMYWPSIDKRMSGRILALEADKKLAFSWQWADDSETRDKVVTVTFEGSTATLTHANYSNSENDKEARQNHIDGWGFFLGQLHDALVSSLG